MSNTCLKAWLQLTMHCSSILLALLHLLYYWRSRLHSSANLQLNTFDFLEIYKIFTKSQTLLLWSSKIRKCWVSWDEKGGHHRLTAVGKKSHNLEAAWARFGPLRHNFKGVVELVTEMQINTVWFLAALSQTMSPKRLTSLVLKMRR